MMKRREFLSFTAAGAAGAVVVGPTQAISAEPAGAEAHSFRVRPFEWEEAGCSELAAAMSSGRETAVSLTKKYLQRIEELNLQGPALRAVLETNPDALDIARALDRERKAKGPRGPLHGIPVLIKDNIATRDRMMTTAGSFALVDSVPPHDSFVAQRLREAGAVILGKTNLSEWANFRADRASSGWSARGGQTHNPYVLDRNPSGSSSGSAAAVSANLCALAVGTETDGSIISPASLCGVVGVKPTLGLISRTGIIPIAHSQDTAGPMARSVRDAALLLGALTGVDATDAATAASAGKAQSDYTRYLDANGMRDARIGIARRSFRPGSLAAKLMEGTLAHLKDLGATLIDEVDTPALNRYGAAEWDVLSFEFKTDINAYLAWLGPKAPVRSLADLIAFNERNKEREMPFFGQEAFLKAQDKGPLTDQAYLDALERCRRFSRAEGIDAAMDKHQLDAIVAPSGGPAGVTDLIYGDRDAGGSSSPAAVAGYPNITVPAGQIHGLPVGLSFFGRAFSEPVLLKLAYAFEQSAKARKPPGFKPTLG